MIAESLLAQVDQEGHRQTLLDEYIDHCTLKDAIPTSEGIFRTNAGTKEENLPQRAGKYASDRKTGRLTG